MGCLYRPCHLASSKFVMANSLDNDAHAYRIDPKCAAFAVWIYICRFYSRRVSLKWFDAPDRPLRATSSRFTHAFLSLGMRNIAKIKLGEIFTKLRRVDKFPPPPIRSMELPESPDKDICPRYRKYQMWRNI